MDVTLILQAIALGLVQGLTEFLPISSSAHLILVPWLFGWNNAVLDSLPFDVALHLGTLLSVLAFFAQDWVRLIRAAIASIIEFKIGNDPDRRLAWLLVLGSIPGAVVGALAETKIEQVFHAPNQPVAAWAIIAMGIIIALLGLVLFVAERVARHVRSLPELRLSDALIIGAAQALAIFPGVSRSGATITAGLFLNLKRDDAARFSFLLSAPIIAGAGLKSLYDVYKGAASGALGSGDLLLYVVGFIAAALSGFLAIRFLLGYLRRHSTDIFVYYRWALAVLIIVVALLRG
jgi:undecaprenyl-diphosphatase